MENKSFLTPEDYGIPDEDSPVYHDGQEREDTNIMRIPEHEKTQGEQTRELVIERQDEKIYKAEAIFKILEEKREELKSKRKTPQIFLIKKDTLMEKSRKKNDPYCKKGFLEQDVLAVVDEKNPNRLNLIYSFSSKGEDIYSFSYSIKNESSKRYEEITYDSFNPDKPIKNFSDKKNRKGDSLYIDISKIKDANELKELLKSRKVTSNNDFEYSVQPKTEEKPEKQISIKELETDVKIGKILGITPVNKPNTDELVKLNLEKIEKSYISPVEEEWLHPTNIVDASSDNISSTRKNIKLLVDQGLIDLDVDNLDDDELINQLVCFQSETNFHEFKNGLVVLNGNILTIPIKTSNFQYQGSRNFIYVGNIDIKNMFRKSKTSNTYHVPSETEESYFHSMKLGKIIHMADYQAIKVVKADPYYDRSLIRSR